MPSATPNKDWPDSCEVKFTRAQKRGEAMEEECRIVNGFKLPPKRHVVVKRKTSPSSSVTGTPPTTSVGGNQRPTLSDAQSDQKHEVNSTLPFGAIRTVFVEFKKKSKCKDIVLPEQPEFQEKWAALVKGITEKIGNGPNRLDALALIDCTIFGGCEHGALIDKSGIYMVNEDSESGGWLDWESFIEKAEIARESSDELMICSQPRLAMDISGCRLTVAQAHKLFGRILYVASGGKVRASQVRPISMRDRLKDWMVYGIRTLIVLALLGLGYCGIMCYAHIQNVEKAFVMMCKRESLGLKEIVSIDVPMWNRWRFGSSKYDCSAKIKTCQSDKIVNVTFTARRVSGTEVLLDPVIIKGDLNAAKQKGQGYFSNDDWDVNWGFWGWIGDDYHIFNVEMK